MGYWQNVSGLNTKIHAIISDNSKTYCAFLKTILMVRLCEKLAQKQTQPLKAGAVSSALERIMEQLHPTHEKKSEDDRLSAAYLHHHGSVFTALKSCSGWE